MGARTEGHAVVTALAIAWGLGFLMFPVVFITFELLADVWNRPRG